MLHVGGCHVCFSRALIILKTFGFCLYCIADTVYDEKKAKERNWEKKQAKLKDIEEARKKQESKFVISS